MEFGSTVTSSFGPSPDLQLISHFGSSVDDAPIIKMEILFSLLIANIHVDMGKLLVLCIINSYFNVFTISFANCECINERTLPTMDRCNVEKTFAQIMTY